MEIIVKAENENDVNKPDEVFNRLYDQLGTRKKRNLEIIHKFVLAILSRAKPKYKMSLKTIRTHLSNNFKEFLLNYFAI